MCVIVWADRGSVTIAIASMTRSSSSIRVDAGKVEDEVAASRVVLVEGPVTDRVRAGEHALYGGVGEGLSVFPPFDRHGLLAAHGTGGDWLSVVAVPVGTDQPPDLQSRELLGEIRDHVAPIHLAVDDHIGADRTLKLDPLPCCPALELAEFVSFDLAAGALAACLCDVAGLRKAADGCRPQSRPAQIDVSHLMHLLSWRPEPAAPVCSWPFLGEGTRGRRRAPPTGSRGRPFGRVFRCFRSAHRWARASCCGRRRCRPGCAFPRGRA